MSNTNDLIRRGDAIDAIEKAKTARTEDGEIYVAKINAEMNIMILPSAQPELIEHSAYIRGFEQGRTQGLVDANLQPTCNQLATDCISRQDAKDRLTILVNEIEGIFADIRERNLDDSVCGLCEYDCDHGIDGSTFECPGFERDDCFKLKDEYRKEWTDVKALPSAQPVITCDGCRFVGTYDTDFPCCSCVRREKDYYEPER